MIASDLIDAFKPWLSDDLENYLTSLGDMFSEIEVYALDSDSEDPGWSLVFDLSRCPSGAFSYTAMYVGERLPPGLSDAAAREWIEDSPNQFRGTLYSIARAAQRSLIGARKVVIGERKNAGATFDVDQLLVMTYTSETPSETLVLQDLLTVVPSDIVLNYTTIAGQTWDLVKNGGANTWQEIKDTYDSWAEVASNQTGVVTYSRPAPL